MDATETVVVFRYIPAHVGDRHNAERPVTLQFHSLYHSLEQYAQGDLRPEGDFVVYVVKGKPDDDGVYPRLELQERVSVEPPEPATPKVKKPAKF